MFQVNGCLSYSEKVPDGFYLIDGMDPYVWSVCMDLQEIGRAPSLESLKAIDSSSDSSIEAVLIDRFGDPVLEELHNAVIRISRSCTTKEEVVDQLAKLVFNHMGLVCPSYHFLEIASSNSLTSNLYINNVNSTLQFCWGLKGFDF